MGIVIWLATWGGILALIGWIDSSAIADPLVMGLATIPAWAAAATYSNRRGVEWTARRNHDE